METQPAKDKITQASPSGLSWQNAPTDLLRAAIDHLHRETNQDNLIAFLLLDVGVELLFKTFMTLHTPESNFAVQYEKEEAAVQRRYHNLIERVEKAAAGSLDGFNMKDVMCFHGLRNKLYHQGDTVAVTSKTAHQYAVLALKLLKALLDVDLHKELWKHEDEKALESKREWEKLKKKREIDSLRKMMATETMTLEKEIELAIEKIEHRLLLPNFSKEFRSIMECYEEEFQTKLDTYAILTQDPQKRKELEIRVSIMLVAHLGQQTQTQITIGSLIMDIIRNLTTDIPSMKDLYLEITKRFIILEEDTLWTSIMFADMYPEYYPPESDNYSPEEILEEGNHLIKDIQSLRRAINDFNANK